MGQRVFFGMKQNEPSVNTAALRAAKKLSPWGTTVPRYWRTSSGCLCTASEKEQKITPASASFSLKVVATETLSNTGDAGQHLLLVQRDAQLLVGLQQLGVHLVQALGTVGPGFGRGIIGDGLVVYAVVPDVGPVGFGHVQPQAVGLQAPFRQPLRLALHGGDMAYDLLAQARRQRLGIDVGDEAVLVFLLDEVFYVLLWCYHKNPVLM